ncbi:unnamed protein product [marine sediment metagenome]|uniref:Lysozyme n=1 Tax=marine sediment metagenome TaxID=412755 RepID=X1C1H3_9ZZZZ
MQKLIDQLIRHEGLRLKPYKCSAGKITIGVGRNIEDNGITEPEAIILLMNDIERCKWEIETAFPWITRLALARYEVLVNMCFNMGIARLSSFKKMLAALESGDYETAAVEGLDSRWANQVGNRAIELMEIMKDG